MLVDQRFDFFARSVVVAFLGGRMDRTDRSARRVDKGVVVGIKRLWNDDLIAVVEYAVECDGERFASAGRDENIACRIFDVNARVIFADSLDHIRYAG